MKISSSLIFTLPLAAQISFAQSPEELTGSWTLQVENLQHEVITTATIHFTNTEASSCLGGRWKQVVVDSSKSSDAEFFPINGNLSFELEGSTLTIGRNEVCDAYRHLSGNLSNGTSSGEYFQFGWGRKQLGYFKLGQGAK